jgi:hypothetical protein
MITDRRIVKARRLVKPRMYIEMYIRGSRVSDAF